MGNRGVILQNSQFQECNHSKPCKYESGKRELPIRHLITLCCLYRVSSDYILGIENFVK